MTEYLFAFISLSLTAAEIYTAVFILLSRFDGRSNFVLRIALIVAAGIAFNALAALVCFYMPQSADLWEAGIYVFQAVLAVMSVWFCFNARFREIAFAGSSAIAFSIAATFAHSFSFASLLSVSFIIAYTSVVAIIKNPMPLKRDIARHFKR